MTDQIEAEPDLGPLVRVHKLNADVSVALLFGVLLALLGVAILIYSGVPYFSASMVAIGSLFVFYWFRRRKTFVSVYANGMTYRGKRPSFRVCWNEIVAIRQESVRHSINLIPVGTTHKFTILTATKSKHILSGEIADIAGLGHHIQQRSLAILLPQAIAIYNSGAMVNFTLLGVSKTGITQGGETLPWSQIKSVGLRNGAVIVKKEGKWLAWASPEASWIPNVFVFLALVSHIMSSESQETRG